MAVRPQTSDAAGFGGAGDEKLANRLLEIDQEEAARPMTVSTMNEQAFRQSVANFRKIFRDKAKKAEDEESRKNEKRPLKVFSEDTLRMNLDGISSGCEKDFIEAGFPPKICAQMVKGLCRKNPFTTEVLEVGCGKGFAGEYLKHEGFHNVFGVDCSYNLLSIAQEKKAYKKLERLVVGSKDVEIPEEYVNAFEFVIVPSMINNGGFDIRVFQQLLQCLRVGGFAIFATKLDAQRQDIYESVVKELTEKGNWAFTAQHSFYRYDKLCGNMGQFSNKLVKVISFQKLSDIEEEKPEVELPPQPSPTKVKKQDSTMGENEGEESPGKKSTKSGAK